MTERLFDYVVSHGTREVPAQRALRAATRRMRGAEMQIGADQGQLMGFLARLIGARRALEIGTFTGYSALSVALALPPDGRLVACDINPETTGVGRRYWREAGVEEKIDLRLGPALETLEGLLREEGEDRFDFAFIDADKGNYDRYYELCLKLVRSGGLIAIDNVLWSGAVADRAARDAQTVAVRALNAKLHGDERVDLCLLPIGDGVTLLRRR
jgi:predicted O-methyltransferase YrrM